MRKASAIIATILFASTLSNSTAKPLPPTDSDYDLCARTVWGETRGQPRVEQAMVAHVIVNRWLSGRWGRSIAGVVRARRQFSAWNETDPNYAVVTAPDLYKLRGFRHARIACELIIRGRWSRDLPDFTENACFYWHGERWPYWAEGERYAKIGAARVIAC